MTEPENSWVIYPSALATYFIATSTVILLTAVKRYARCGGVALVDAPKLQHRVYNLFRTARRSTWHAALQQNSITKSKFDPAVWMTPCSYLNERVRFRGASGEWCWNDSEGERYFPLNPTQVVGGSIIIIEIYL